MLGSLAGQLLVPEPVGVRASRGGVGLSQQLVVLLWPPPEPHVHLRETIHQEDGWLSGRVQVTLVKREGVREGIHLGGSAWEENLARPEFSDGAVEFKEAGSVGVESGF